jgi:hypothetical protein
LKINFIVWRGLDVLYRQHFTTRYNNMLNAHKDKWGTDTVYNVIRDMTENKLALNDLDPALASRLQGMKDSLLNRHFLNFKWDSISYSLNSIKEWYKMLKKVGFTWPELSSFENMTPEQQIIGLKTPIIKGLLQLFKNQDTSSVVKVLAELKRAGMEWPELAVMEKSLSTKQIDEDLHPARIKAVDESLRNGDYIGAAHYMGVYGVNIDEFDNRVRERFEELKDDIIKEILQVVKNIPLDRSYKLISNVRKAGLGWPEIEIIFKSLDHSYTEKYR